MDITADSHVDHGLTPEHLAWLRSRLPDRAACFIETVELPDHLESLQCGLHGPRVGDAPVPEAEVHYEVRGRRVGPSRCCSRSPRPSRLLTVIAGPHGGRTCVLYTAYGGPQAPCEPWEPGLSDEVRAESEAFWSEHALSGTTGTSA